MKYEKHLLEINEHTRFSRHAHTTFGVFSRNTHGQSNCAADSSFFFSTIL